MIHAYHAIFGTYGHWLPNDPRGSWSDFVRAWELYRFGPAQRTDLRTKIPPASREYHKLQLAKQHLKYPAVDFSGVHAREVANAFARTAAENNITVFACSILSNHVHLIVERHRWSIEQIVNRFKGAATRRLFEQSIHPFAEHQTDDESSPKMWARGRWKVYLDADDVIENAIAYVEENPTKEGKPRQKWKFLKPVTGIEGNIVSIG